MLEGAPVDDPRVAGVRQAVALDEGEDARHDQGGDRQKQHRRLHARGRLPELLHSVSPPPAQPADEHRRPHYQQDVPEDGADQ